MTEYIIDMGRSSYESQSGLLSADVSQLHEEIVRCRDCVSYITNDDGYGGNYCTCAYFDCDYAEVEPDGFCAWGERSKS